MIKKTLIIALVVLLSTQTAQASSCYTQDQFRAEQALRFHTRLMIIGMLCQGILKRNTYAEYQGFTARNQNVIQEQENSLISYFRQVRKPNPERALHSLRTDLANEAAQQAGASVGVFCQKYISQLQMAKTMRPIDFKHWIQGLALTLATPTTTPVCAATH